jgi:hypothetical protein
MVGLPDWAATTAARKAARKVLVNILIELASIRFTG